MIRRILAWAARHGVNNAVMNLHHCPETITAIVGDGRDLGLAVRYSWELPRILGSAGGPRLALPIVGAPQFFILNGDTLTDLDLHAIAAQHRASGARVTLAVVPNRAFLKYGGVRADRNGDVTGFTARGANAEGTWHFVGVQVVDASVFASLASGEAAQSIGGVYDALLRKQPGSVRVHCGDWEFFDVGSPADYLRTVTAFCPSGIDIGARSAVDASARVVRSVLWEDVEVGAEASLQDCILTDGVRVPARAIYQRSILMTGDHGLIVTPIESADD